MRWRVDLSSDESELTIEEATYFHRKLIEYRMPFGGFIVNRVHADALREPGANEEWELMRNEPVRIFQAVGVTGTPLLAARIAENFDRFQALAEMDAAGIARLKQTCAGSHLWRIVPAFDFDLHDLADLARVNGHLFAGQDE